jgi:hypothetical protein
MPTGIPVVLAFLAGLLAAMAQPAASQTVQGQLLNREDRGPVDGAFILLLTVEGEQVGGYLTNQAGRFLLHAPGPGRYSLRAERIGYETVTSDPFDLSRDQTLHLDLETGFSAIQLDEIRVEGEQECVVRPGEGLEVARVWDEARKALTVQEWTEGEGFYSYRITNFERELDAQARTVLSETRRVASATARNPIRSLPVENLIEEGFVRKNSDGTFMYYGMDAAVLLSDLFLDTHCFRLRTDNQNPGAVGLAFEPVRRQSLPDVSGILWLDRETSTLQYLEFTYTWAPWEEAIGVGRGRVDFEEMPSGAWIIRKWWIQMPRGTLDRNMLSGDPVVRLVGVSETGGEITRISIPGGEVVRESVRGLLAGSVWDQTLQRPLAGALVYLSGTPFSAVTDSVGRFLMDDLPEGGYTAAFTHPRLDSLGTVSPGVHVEIREGEVAEVELEIPPGSAILAKACQGEELEKGTSVLRGTIRDAITGTPLSGVTVRVTWSSFDNPGGRNLREIQEGFEFQTGSGGQYVACGVPVGPTLTVLATFMNRETQTLQLRAQADRPTIADLALKRRDPLRPSPAGARGTPGSP